MLPETLKNIIKQIKELIRACLTYLFIKAIEKNKSFYAQILLALGANVNAINSKGDTALHIACRRQQRELFNILINTPQINIDILNGRGKSAMLLAEKHGYNEAVDTLLKLHMSGGTTKEDVVTTPPAEQLLLLNFNKVKRQTLSKEERKELKKKVSFSKEEPECHKLVINKEEPEYHQTAKNIEHKEIESKEMSPRVFVLG